MQQQSCRYCVSCHVIVCVKAAAHGDTLVFLGELHFTLMPVALTTQHSSITLCIHYMVPSCRASVVMLHVASWVQGQVHRSWVQAQSLLSPLFDNLAPEQKHLTLLQQVLHCSPVSRCRASNVSHNAHLSWSQQAVLHACLGLFTLSRP